MCHQGPFFPGSLHAGIACMTNFPSPLPRSDVCPQAGIYLSFVLGFLGHQLIRNGLFQEAPHPTNCACNVLASFHGGGGWSWQIHFAYVSKMHASPNHQLCRDLYHPPTPAHQLRSTHHVCKFKERYQSPNSSHQLRSSIHHVSSSISRNVINHPPTPTHQLRSIHHVCKPKNPPMSCVAASTMFQVQGTLSPPHPNSSFALRHVERTQFRGVGFQSVGGNNDIWLGGVQTYGDFSNLGTWFLWTAEEVNSSTNIIWGHPFSKAVQ